MKLKLDSKSKSLPQASKLKKKHGEKKSHVNESSKSQAENQNSTELHLEQEALTLDEAPLQQLLDSAPPLDYSEVCCLQIFSGNLWFQLLYSCWIFAGGHVIV